MEGNGANANTSLRGKVAVPAESGAVINGTKVDEWKHAMQDLLDSVESMGDFCTGGKIELPRNHPKIRVKGMEDNRLAFPLPVSQAKALIEVSEKAPFGKGRDTVLDESVRKAWQVDAENVEFDEANIWDRALQGIARNCVATLGLTASQQALVHANLYKMLIYEKGGHFRKHRDTEKEPGMFGTLVVQLQSKHTGGGLVIRHGYDTRKFDFSKESEDECFFTGFYADCEHEFLPVSSGYRLCLVYNLVMAKSSIDASLPFLQHGENSRQLRTLANQLNSIADINKVQGYLLEHKYTETNLRFRNLKGRDKHVADFLKGSVDTDGKPLFGVSLLLYEHYEQGSAEYDHRSRFYGSDDDDDGHHTMEEVHDSRTGPIFWIGPDDTPIRNFPLGFDATEQILLCEDDCDANDLFEGDDPDKQKFESYTGNAGPTLEYWYYKSILVFWPKSHGLKVASAAGMDFLVSSLMACHDKTDVQAYGSLLIKLIQDKKQSVNGDILKAITRVGDECLIKTALEQEVIDICGSNFCTSIVDIVNMFPSEAVWSAVLRMMERCSKKYNMTYNSSGVSSAVGLFNAIREHVSPDFAVKARQVTLEGALSIIDAIATDASMMVDLVPLVVLDDTSLGVFVEAVRKSSAQCSAILNCLMDTPRASTCQHIKSLAAFRAATLKQATCQGKPILSWRQPGAKFSGSKTELVNSFLRGPETTETFHGFKGVGHARNWAKKYFGRLVRQQGYSATAQSGGRGEGAYVRVTKTRDSYEASVLQFNANVAELERLGSFFGADIIQGESSTSEKRPADGTNASSRKTKARKSKENEGIENPILF